MNLPPILEPILVGVGMFTESTGVLTHSHLLGVWVNQVSFLVGVLG